MIIHRIVSIIFFLIPICHSSENLFNISLAIINTRTVLACGSSIIISLSFNSTEILHCPSIILDEHLQWIEMKLSKRIAFDIYSNRLVFTFFLGIEEEMKINLTSSLIPSPKLNNSTQWNMYYLSFSSELTCRYSAKETTTICFYYPSSRNFREIEKYFDRMINTNRDEIRRRYTLILIILGILVLIVCLFALGLLCSNRISPHHRIELGVRIDPQLARETALKLAPEPV